MRMRHLVLAAVVAVAIAASIASAGPAAAAARYTITGRGRGHGVGMSQWGAYGYAKHGFAYGRILGHYFPGVTLAGHENSVLRVLLSDGAAEASLLSSTSALALVGAASSTTLAASHVGLVGVSPTGLWVRDKTAATPPVDLGTEATASATPGAVITLVSPDANRVAGRRWRGLVRLLSRGGFVRVVNVVPIEDYLRGVVPCEVSASWPIEALKAQAVAARSYALSSHAASSDFDLFATVASQYYGGHDREARATDAAVSATRGLVAMSTGSIARTYFFASSGGRTEAVQNVWGGPSVPYLPSVDDPYDILAPQHIWSPAPTVDETALASRLGSYSATNTAGVKGSLRGVRITRRGFSPRVRNMVIEGSRGTTTLSGERFRSVLGLRSTWFSVLRCALNATPTTLAAGGWVRIRGSASPLPAGGRVTLRFREGALPWRALTTTLSPAGALDLSMHPKRTVVYELVAGQARSPRITVVVVPTIKLAGPTAVDYGRKAKLSLALTPSRPGTYARVLIQRSTESRPSQIAHPKLTSRPTTLTVDPGRNATLTVIWGGDAMYGPTRLVRPLTVRAVVTLGASAASVVTGQPITLSGAVVPSEPNHQVWIQHLDGAVWTNVLKPRTGADSAYSVRWRPKLAGAYWIRAFFPSPGPDYVAGASPRFGIQAR